MTDRPALLRRSGVSGRRRPYQIRPAADGDAPALVALQDAVAGEGGLIAAVPGERSALEEELTLAGIRAGGGLAVVVEVGGELVGALLVHRHQAARRRHRAELALMVALAYRGEGLGTALMDTAVEWARAVGITKLGLSVFPDNAAAIGLYRSFGFESEGLRRRHVLMPDGPRDVLSMALLL